MSIQGMGNKKAVVEAQLTWVFILIVGAIILLFFVGIVQKQRTIAELKGTAEIVRQLDAMITGAEVSAGKSTMIRMPKIEIEMEKETGGCEAFSIGRTKRSVKNRVLFAPDVIKGRNLITYSMAWNLPFRVTNFLYMTSSDVRYIFVDPPTDFYKDLPEFLNKENISSLYIPGLKDRNNYKIRFIFFGGSLTDPAPDLRGEITAVVIEGDIDGKGSVDFYEKGTNGQWQSAGNNDFAGKALVLGAIFAENVESYRCAKDKALDKLEKVAEVYLERIRTIDPLSDCNYNNAIGILSNPGSLYISTSSLESENLKMQFNSCPLIY